MEEQYSTLELNYKNLKEKYNGIYNENQIYRNDILRLKNEMKELTEKL